MTGRGIDLAPSLPGPDPTLETRPVPQERQNPVRSFGPGASHNIQETARPLEELEQEIEESGFKDDTSDDGDTEIKYLLELLTSECHIDWRGDASDTQDPTWGPSLVVTAYSEKAQRNLDRAISNLTETAHRYFLRFTGSQSKLFAREAFNRLSFDVIENRELLENASDDRVREEFNAHVRSLRLYPADLRFDKLRAKRLNDGLNRPSGPRRFDVCIVLDEAAVEELAALRFLDNLEGDGNTLRDISVKMVERDWSYPEEADSEQSYGFGQQKKYYTGVDMCPIYDLPFVCGKLYEHAGLGEMFPLFMCRDNH
ncbi:hypothetical protein FSARC_13945 [Fusarium sarcochroum]|uniref:Uncharacterized protein n=1 Tax=Fusarium sarcochroum TaxID=1208366 RepID=A0A8H4SXD0_9HYPO|nr:hypothetical protein FSARC_13945 [Fusarium sarcochroum]